MHSVNSLAWTLACRLFEQGGPALEHTFSETERRGLATLTNLKAVKQQKLDLRFALCPYCELDSGPVVQGAAGLECQCPDCGPVPLDPHDRRGWLLDPDWVIRKLRAAFDVPVQQGHVSVISGIWRIGHHQQHPLILARSLDHVLRHLGSLPRASTNGTSTPWLISPKPLRDVAADPFAGAVLWLPMQERFTLYGGNLQFHEPGSAPIATGEAFTQAVNGPFSQDFRTVHLPGWRQGAIGLTLGQAAIFKVLWQEEGKAILGERLMRLAQSSSDKPYELFKIKSKNKGDALYEGPLHAYRTLVEINAKESLYKLSGAAINT